MQRSARALGALAMLVALVLALVAPRPLAAPAAGAAPAPALAPPSAAPPVATPAKVQDLLNLLSDPEIRAWVEQQRAQPAAATAAPEPSATPAGWLAGRLAMLRTHVQGLAAAVPRLPDELERAWVVLYLELQDEGLWRVLLLVLGFVALGFGVERLFWWATTGLRRWINERGTASVRERLEVVGARLLFGVGLVVSFAVGSVGAFLAFHWPPLLREIVLGYLLAFLATRLAFVAGRFLLAPGSRPPFPATLLRRAGARSPAAETYFQEVERFRIVPMSTAAARFWHVRLGLLVGWLAFGWVTVGLLATLGFSPDARRLVAYTLGLGLLALALEAVWRRPSEPPAAAVATVPAEAVPTEGGIPTVDTPVPQTSRPARRWLATAGLVGLWLLWVVGAMPSFWLLIVALGLPAAIRLAERATAHVLRPPGSADADTALPSVPVVAIERGLRALLIIGAALLLLAWAWGLDLVELTARDTLATRLLRGALSATIIVLLADLAWHMVAAWIDRRLALAGGTGVPPPGAGEGGDGPSTLEQVDSETARRRARLRTLLPIFKNVLLVVLVAMAALMALSALGVEIGPLIAGAGVVGVAIGFGAQTLVKDIISGMFFLLDDAFRVGEYIQSGSHKGTVESFSLRSVKLRHHRGPLTTIPFGELTAIENMSRDWVIDKLTVGVTYDTDLEKARKLVKQIGRELKADPEYGPHILEPLKMQGVEQFGDFAIQLRMKMMTRPGEQFVIRRKAYATIKKAFDANGIKFAFPTVQVAGGEATPAAAQQALELIRSPAPAA